MRNGIYNYRFSGDSMKSGLLHRLVGVGSVRIENQKVTDGHHRSSLMVLQGGSPKLKHNSYTLTGDATYEASERNWIVSLNFIEQNPESDQTAQVLRGAYRAVANSDDRYWIISAGADTMETGKPKPATEISSGEIVWVSEL